ncbi:MAG: TolC family protein [Planctomycetales bacterium]
MARKICDDRLALAFATVLTVLGGCSAAGNQWLTATPVTAPEVSDSTVPPAMPLDSPRIRNAARLARNAAAAADPAADATAESTGVRTVQHTSDGDQTRLEPAAPLLLRPPDDSTVGGGATSPTPDADRPSMPIDFPTALRLGGANHLQIALAAERVRESAARLDQADVLWVPSLNAGVGYNRHDGQIQDTRGGILDVSRQSLYAGGGPAIGSSPLSGGASGPARLFVDLSLSDVFFEPLVARQNLRAFQFDTTTAFNDSLLQVGVTYQELIRAQTQVGIAEEAVRNAEELARITENFARAGTGLEADAQRARAELEQRRRERSVAQERVQVVSAELVRLLRLDSQVTLVAIDPQPLPLNLLPPDMPIENLVAQGLTRRPELATHQARVAETLEQIRQEKWRPWLPHLFVGYAGAGFGGGPNSQLGDFGGRGDFDALAVWEVKNLGLGNRALQRQRQSQHRQAHLEYAWIRDQVIAEVSQAHYRSTYRREQIEHARRQVAAAADALPLNFRGIRDGQLRPIEAQQAIAGLAAARNLHLASIIDYNQAQLELLRAVGEPPTSDGSAPPSLPAVPPAP